MSSIEGIPEGWELVKFGVPESGDWVLDPNGEPLEANCGAVAVWPIIRKIERPKKYRAFANAAEFKPYRDRWLSRIDEDGLRIDGEFRQHGFDDTGIWLGSNPLSYKDALDRGHTFDDGTPFGVEVTP